MGPHILPGKEGGRGVKMLNRVIDWIEEQMLWILMFAMVVIVFIQVVLRELGSPLSWTEETARYVYLWMCYLGCSRGVRFRSEVSVDVIRNLFKDESKARAVYDLVGLVISTVFSFIFARYSIMMIGKLIQQPQHSPACHYNMIFVYMSVVVSSILMLFRYLQNMYKEILLFIDPQRITVMRKGGME